MSTMPQPGQNVTVEVLTSTIRSLLEEDDPRSAKQEPTLESGSATVVATTAQTLTLAYDKTTENPRPCPPGTKLVLHYHDENGLYLTLAKVVEHDVAAGTFTVQTQGHMGHQRRRHPRVNVALNMHYQLATGIGPAHQMAGQWQEARARDISSGGILMETLGQIAPGTAVLLAIQLPAGTVHAKGRVTRTRPGSRGKLLAGVRFTEVTPEDLGMIDEFIADKLAAVNG